MASTRWGTSIAGALLAVLVVALGSARVASGALEGPNEACNPDGRLFCLTVSTFSGITASDPSPTRTNGKRYTWVEWEMANDDGSTLTHPTVTVTLADYDCSADVPPLTDPATECAARTLTSDFVEPPPAPCTKSGGALTCPYANLPEGGATPTTVAYFKTADLPATHTVITVRGTVKERANDGNPCDEGDPNCDTFATTIVNSYESQPGQAETFARFGESFFLDTDDTLGASGDGASSFTFSSGSPATFRANFKSNTSACTPATPTCFQRTLEVTAFDAPAAYNAGAVLFYGRLTNLPAGLNQNNLTATHVYDPVELTAQGNVFTPPTGYTFVGITKVTIGAQEYFVVNYSATSNTFQLSLTSGGPAASFADGTYTATPAPQVIGDQSSERWTSPGAGGCTFTPSGPLVVPSICVKRVQGLSQTFDTWIRDRHNGLIKWP